MSRIYVCHTYYHVFVSILKEYNFYKNDVGNATMVLSTMSTDFENLKDRLSKSNIFHEVLVYDEKPFTFFDELTKYKQNTGNIVSNLINRVIFTKKYARLQEQYIPTDFSKYDEVFVFCDSDPIGYYLNYKRIEYCELEDGLDTLSVFNHAKYDNMGSWKLKRFMSMYLNLIFIQDGYSKYCTCVEVNNKSIVHDIADCNKYIEVSRNDMIEALSPEEKKTILSVFVKNMDKITETLGNLKEGEKSVLILTEPLCELDVRKQIFRDLVSEYSKEGVVLIKPHPRDMLDYNELFPNELVFDKTVPMEMFRLLEGVRFSKVVSVYTQLASITFADEKVYLGNDFMDKYEAPEIHRKKEALEGK